MKRSLPSLLALSAPPIKQTLVSFPAIESIISPCLVYEVPELGLCAVADDFSLLPSLILGGISTLQ